LLLFHTCSFPLAVNIKVHPLESSSLCVSSSVIVWTSKTHWGEGMTFCKKATTVSCVMRVLRKQPWTSFLSALPAQPGGLCWICNRQSKGAYFRWSHNRNLAWECLSSWKSLWLQSDAFGKKKNDYIFNNKRSSVVVWKLLFASEVKLHFCRLPETLHQTIMLWLDSL